MDNLSVACFMVFFVTVAVTFCFSVPVDTVYLLRPNTSTPCSVTTAHAKCLTLEEFAEGEELGGNTTSAILLFMAGIHSLSSVVEVKLFPTIIMQPLAVDAAKVIITCTGSAGFYFYDIKLLLVKQLSFISCSTKGMYGIVIVLVTSANFVEIEMSNSTFTAIKVIDSNATLESIIICHCGHLNSNVYAGAIHSYQSEILISGNSDFTGNKAMYGGAVVLTHGKLSIKGEAVTFADNRALIGGGLHINSADVVEIGGNVTFINNTADFGGGAIYVDNTAALILSGIYQANTAQNGGAAWITHSNIVTMIGGVAIHFKNNRAVELGGSIYLEKSILRIQVDGFSMVHNMAGLGGAMYSYDSVVVFNARATFANNSALEGGAYYLDSESYYSLGEESHVTFTNNTAGHKGGALYVEANPGCYSVQHPLCFFEVQKAGKFLQFENNSASAGNVLYGGHIEHCWLRNCTDNCHHYNFFSISNVIRDTQTQSNIASNPFKVCLCNDGVVGCSNMSHGLTVFPGQKFNVSVATVGQINGVVPATILAALSSGSLASLGATQNSQKTLETCSNISFQVYSKRNCETITLTVGACSGLTTENNFQLNVNLTDCPVGFQLSDDPAQCVCQDRLLQYTERCTVEDQMIHRTSNFWVGYDIATQGLILHPHCPFDYCVIPPSNFTMQFSDQQCNYNRTRLLCGLCQDGLSLVLGTSRCLKCSNDYLTLLAAFGVAGLALVVLLFGCRLTVAKGTINALIFYANIVHNNRTVFFPNGNTNVLTVFVAWLNLDLGIETCFYDGMDTYVRTWLQFAFPLYVWLLCGSIIFASSKSYRVSRIFGTNPVAVLATLFLLSYTKLLHTAIATFSYTILSYPHGHSKLVWLYDANIGYLQGKHIPLFVVGLVVFSLCLPYALILLTSPWLQTWSNHRFLYWINSHRMKFFLDAYNAPFKPKHGYWTGLLLCTRIALMIVFAHKMHCADPSLNLAAVCAGTMCISLWPWVFGRPYRSYVLTFIEAAFFLNLMLLSAFTLYSQSTNGNIAALAYTSTALSLAVFAVVLFSHGYIVIKETRIWKLFTEWRAIHRITTESSEDDSDGEKATNQHVTCSEVVIPRPNRESCSPISSGAHLTGSHLQTGTAVNTATGRCQVTCNSESFHWAPISGPCDDAELREPLLLSDPEFTDH